VIVYQKTLRCDLNAARDLVERMRNEPCMPIVRVHAIEAVVLLVRGSRGAAEHAGDGAGGTW